MKTLIVAILMLLTAKSFAADSSGNYNIRGHGGQSCGKVIEEYRKNSPFYLYMTTWVSGYFTAINALVYEDEDIWQGTDLAGAMLWIRNYCQSNPLDHLAGAAESLYYELRDK